MHTQQTQQTQYDKMANTPIPQLVTKLSIPTILSMLVSNIYNLVDTAFVGTLGTSASGAVGIVFGFMAILQAIGFLFGQGSGSILSRKLGEKEVEQASEVASTGFFTALILSMIAALICFYFLDPLVILLGSTKTIAPYAKTYIMYILVAAPFLVTSFTLNNILRYEGRAALGMIGMMTGAVLNIFGDMLFMFGFKMGIAGAGLSTAISQLVSFCILLSMFLRNKTQCRISFKKICRKPAMYGDIMATGFPSLLRQALHSITTILLNSKAGLYGDAAVAAMSIVSRVTFFAFSFALGVGQGFQPVSGFNYGAKNYGRVRQAYRFTLFLSEAIMIVMVIILFAVSGDIIQIFRDDAEVITVGTRALRLAAASQLFLPACMVSEMLFQSTGQRVSASFLSATRSGLFAIPAIYFLEAFRGLAGIQEAQPLATVLSFFPAVIMAILFFRKLPIEE